MMEIPFESSYWVVENKLLAGKYPGSMTPENNFDNLKDLINVYIKSIINLTEEREEEAYFHSTYISKYRNFNEDGDFEANHQRFSIKDMDIPPVELMIRILDQIDKCISLGNKVYVHCIGGTGRTGTVIGCWLIRHGITEPGDAIKKIAELRGDGKRSPETSEQEEFLLKWKKGQ